jgi:hypothetical protein
VSNKIYDIVKDNGAIIYADSENEFFITWNGSATFQWFKPAHYAGIFFDVVDIRTVYGVTTIEQAEAEAKEWAEYELSMVEHFDFSNLNR